MRKRFGRRGVGVIASLTLAAAAAPLLGACEATPAKDDPSLGVPTSETPSANAEAAEYEPTQFTEVPGGLPLTPYFDAYHALDQAVQTGQSMRERADWLNEREAETASCMKKAGFEYYPRQVEAADFFSTNPFVALEGDMVAVSYLPDTLAEVQATGYGIRPVTDPADKPVNPTEPDPTEEDIKNQEYREGLSASAGAAYDMALTGWDGTDEGRDAEVGGCAAVVDQKHPEPAADDSASTVMGAYSELVSTMAYLVRGQVATDSVVVGLDRDWESCMVAKGYEFRSRGPIGEGWSTDRMPTWGLTIAGETGADGSVRDPAADVEDLPDDQRSLIGSEAEIKVAVDDFECREESDYMDTLIGRVRALQEEFIADNQKALDQFMAAVEELDL